MSMTAPVVPEIVPPVTADEVLALGGLATGGNNAVVAERAIVAATGLVYQHCGTSFPTPPVEEVREFEVLDDDLPLIVDDFQVPSSVEVRSATNDDVWTAPREVSVVTPVAGFASRTISLRGERSWERMRDDDDLISVSAIWGWAAIPDAVIQAITLTAQRLITRQASKAGILGFADFNFGDYGGESRYLSSRLDSDVERLLAPYAGRRQASY